MPADYMYDIRIFGTDEQLKEDEEYLNNAKIWNSDSLLVYRSEDRSNILLHSMITTSIGGKFPISPLEFACSISEKYKDILVEYTDWLDDMSGHFWCEEYAYISEKYGYIPEHFDCTKLGPKKYMIYLNNGGSARLIWPDEEIYELADSLKDLDEKTWNETDSNEEKMKKLRIMESGVEKVTSGYLALLELSGARYNLRGGKNSLFEERKIVALTKRADFLNSLSYSEIQRLRLKKLLEIQDSYLKDKISKEEQVHALYSLVVYLFYATPNWRYIRQEVPAEVGEYALATLEKAIDLNEQIVSTKENRIGIIDSHFSILWGMAMISQLTPGKEKEARQYKKQFFEFWKNNFANNAFPDVLFTFEKKRSLNDI